MREVAGALGNTVEPLPEHLWSSISSRMYEDHDHELLALTLLDADGVSPSTTRRPPRAGSPRANCSPPARRRRSGRRRARVPTRPRQRPCLEPPERTSRE
jgi:hypothetical protein